MSRSGVDQAVETIHDDKELAQRVFANEPRPALSSFDLNDEECGAIVDALRKDVEEAQGEVSGFASRRVRARRPEQPDGRRLVPFARRRLRAGNRLVIGVGWTRSSGWHRRRLGSQASCEQRRAARRSACAGRAVRGSTQCPRASGIRSRRDGRSAFTFARAAGPTSPCSRCRSGRGPMRSTSRRRSAPPRRLDRPDRSWTTRSTAGTTSGAEVVGAAAVGGASATATSLRADIVAGPTLPVSRRSARCHPTAVARRRASAGSRRHTDVTCCGRSTSTSEPERPPPGASGGRSRCPDALRVLAGHSFYRQVQHARWSRAGSVSGQFAQRWPSRRRFW